MKNYTEYKKLMKNEVEAFKSQINPTMNNSPQKGNERINKFLEILPKLEKHMDEYCKKYFQGETFSPEELVELKSVNTEIYNDFIDYCKIPNLSKNN